MEKSPSNLFAKLDDDADQENRQTYDEEGASSVPINFTPEELETIESRRRILASLAYFIGKDFQIPVELNEPGAGWHWDFQKNIIRVDPKDLLEKPMDYLRFVISHEGGHRRISRTEFIPAETWRQPGFAFMMNAIEDPRDNNFVAENYPKFREQMQLAYEMNLDLENRSKEKAEAKLGYQPRFMQAGFEYIKQWFLDQEDGYKISEDLPDEVKQVVQDTLQSARRSWTTYPSRGGADGKETEIATDGRTVSGEALISEYAKASYQINLERVWPEFRKLVEKDMEDQRTQELLDEMQQSKADSGSQSLPQELSDQLTPEEQKELEEAIDKAIEKAKQDNIERLLIIEDDLFFYPEFTKLEQKIVTLLQQKPWGMVYLGHFIPPKALSDNLLQEYLDPILCSHLVGFHQSTFNELISHLKAILKREAGDPAGGPMHIDGAYNHFREKNREFKTLVINPSLGTQRSSRSDVAPLRWFDRIPILNSFFNFLRNFKNK